MGKRPNGVPLLQKCIRDDEEETRAHANASWNQKSLAIRHLRISERRKTQSLCELQS